MGTNVYQGRTTVSEWRELIRKLGGTPKGKTVAQLQDEYESLVGEGGGADVVAGSLSDDDIDDVFGDGA